MIQLSDHFTYSKLLRYTFPSIVMLSVTSIYSVVDGLFVSNFVGKTPFAAINLIWPFLMILSSVGFMFGTGGAALIGKTLGEGNPEKANRIFSLIIYVSAACGVMLMVFGILLCRRVAVFFGAEGQLLEDSVLYGRIYMLGVPACVLQYEFQTLFPTAERPKLGLYVTVAAGVTNIVLDALFVGMLPFGIAGAAAASALSQCVGGFVPLFYFGRKNTSKLRLIKTNWDGNALLRCCTNGSSELLSNISMAIVGMLYNVQLMRYVGEDGVAAYGVLMYVNLIFLAIFIGYSVGVAPVVSFHYGAGNHKELHSLLRKSFVIIGISSVVMFFAAECMAQPLSRMFVSYDDTLLQITMRGFLLYSFSFLFVGVAIFGPSFFTALNNGLVSAAISFLRTLVFEVAAVLLLPMILDVDGIWLSVVGAELMAAMLSIFFLIKNRKKYQY